MVNERKCTGGGETVRVWRVAVVVEEMREVGENQRSFLFRRSKSPLQKKKIIGVATLY
jgi:hypothetical protein